MSSTTRLLVSLGLALGAASAVGCSAQTSSSDAATGDDQAITGVTDLVEMEAAFGLSKDFKTADGKWYRTDALLKNGPCYKKLIGGADGASYQFRRYSNGASFFKKLGAGAASGDERPVVCVDIDLPNYDGTATETTSIADFEIDGAIRYRFGKPTGGEGAAGSLYETFEGGAVHYINQFCYDYANGSSEFTFDALSPAAMNSECLAGATFPGSTQEIDGTALLIVYQHAYNQSTGSDRFSSQADAVGRFISVEGDWSSPVQHIRYEHLDMHIVRAADSSTATYFLTPKNSDASIQQSAVTTCTRGANQDDGTVNVTCTGL